VGDLVTLLDDEKIGQNAALKVVRAGEPKDLQITIGSRP
jgi:S1-C subfamily serine protease